MRGILLTYRLAVPRSLHSFFAPLAMLTFAACGLETEAATDQAGDDHYRELHLAIELLCIAELPCSDAGNTLSECVDFAWAIVYYSYPEHCYPEATDYTLCLRDTACTAPSDAPDPCAETRDIVTACAEAQSDNL